MEKWHEKIGMLNTFASCYMGFISMILKHQTWKYGISKTNFILKSSTAIDAISFGIVPKQVELKNTCMNECNDPKHWTEKKKKVPKVTIYEGTKMVVWFFFFNLGVSDFKKIMKTYLIKLFFVTTE